MQLISLNRLNKFKKIFIFPKFIGPYSSELNKLYTSELNSESIKIFIDSTITFFEDKKSDLKIHPLNFQFKENINKKEKEFINAFIYQILFLKMFN